MEWSRFDNTMQRRILHHASRGNTLSKLATVCREWAALIEETNFAKLDITSNDLGGFLDFVHDRPHRHHLLQYLRFVVEIPVREKVDELESMTFTDEVTIRVMLGRLGLLLDILSAWDIDKIMKLKPEYDGLTLEVSVRPYGCPWQLAQGGRTASTTLSRSASVHGPPSEYERPSAGGFWSGTSQVDLITKLYLLERTDAHVPPSAVFELCEKLPLLTEICYEPGPTGSNLVDTEFLRFSLSALTLSRKSDTFRNLHILYQNDRANGAQRNRGSEASQDMVEILCRASLTLEEVVICNVIEAGAFFKKMALLEVPRLWDRWKPWSRLRHVTLATDAFHPNDRAATRSLLLLAAFTARSMPALQAMELFRVGHTCGAMFQYTNWSERSEGACILWQSSWRFQFEEDERKE
ncbi:hypothetical protein QQS21_005621 [Conoideocrella luteorostrata]|uniref:DUF6546 domain-containing protein n=1 Tax=Conoideocrella luteorostrata TaxID=1105319 RepID=A0AAJ0CP59_9HYPO|nr:hypothetical protein QQS21_005621 [Conoideocrella luteorostrata]